MHLLSVPFLLSLLATSPASTVTALAELQEHELVQRSIEDKTWALETRQSIGDISTCDGCHVSCPLGSPSREWQRIGS